MVDDGTFWDVWDNDKLVALNEKFHPMCWTEDGGWQGINPR